MTELEEVQAIVVGAEQAAAELSLSGKHVAAARVQGLVQLARVLWTHLHPPAPAVPQPEPPAPNGEPPRGRLEAVD